jgi:serine/threonine-protein kinase
VAILEDSLDRDHPRMAAVLQGLSGVYAARGEYGAAEALLKRALDIRVRALGEGHPDVAATRDLLAKLRSAKPGT